MDNEAVTKVLVILGAVALVLSTVEQVVLKAIRAWKRIKKEWLK